MRRSDLARLAVAALSAAGPVFAAQAAGGFGGVAKTPPSGLTQVATNGSDFEALAAKARAAGSVRIIAVLDIGFEDPGKMSEAEISRQTARLRAAQDAVIERVLGGDRSAVTTFDLVPYLGMSVTAEQLQKLDSDPIVASIREDSVAAPTGVPPGKPS